MKSPVARPGFLFGGRIPSLRSPATAPRARVFVGFIRAATLVALCDQLIDLLLQLCFHVGHDVLQPASAGELLRGQRATDTILPFSTVS
jgi:hypothetical protein